MSKNNCEISFYRLSKYPIVKALPKLLERALQSNKRCLVLCNNPEEMAELNDVLWTYSSRAFLPHGSSKDQNPELQPILLSVDGANLNSASVLVVLSETIPDSLDQYEKCLDLFYDNNSKMSASTKKRHEFYTSAGYKLKYWTQNEDGGWNLA